VALSVVFCVIVMFALLVFCGFGVVVHSITSHCAKLNQFSTVAEIPTVFQYLYVHAQLTLEIHVHACNSN
jgi:hypothetical protein